MFSSRLKVIGIIIAIGIILITFLSYKLRSKSEKPQSESQSSQPAQVSQNDKPQIVSTKPDPLEDNIISATDAVEITFNRSLENEGQFKIRIEPKVDYKIELINGKKTARIIPVKSYQLGFSYTLFIDPDTKFDGVGEWKQDKIFHFRTITYRGV